MSLKSIVSSAIALIVIAVLVMAVVYWNNHSLTLIAGATLIDGTGKPPIEGAAVVINRGKIASVRSLPEGAIPRKPLFAKKIDASGKFIIPGLMDMHVHLTHREFLDLFLINGVTTVRDVGNDTDFIIGLRDDINNGRVQGPTVFAAGTIINDQKIPFGASQYTEVVKTVEQAKKMVAEHAAKKVDLIKIYISLPAPLVKAVIDQATKYGLPVAGHIRLVNARTAVLLGIRSLEHATGISEALLGEETFEDAPPLWTISDRTWPHVDRSKFEDLAKILVEKNVFVAADLILYDAFLRSPDDIRKNPDAVYVPKEIREGWDNYLRGKFLEITANRENWEISKARLTEFLLVYKQKGGKILAGTDTPWAYFVPGFALHKELEELVRAGLTTTEALLAATKYAAEAMNREASLGTVEKGKQADLLILNSDPLVDIRNTRDIDLVIKGGQPLDPKAVRARLQRY